MRRPHDRRTAQECSQTQADIPRALRARAQQPRARAALRTALALTASPSDNLDPALLRDAAADPAVLVILATLLRGACQAADAQAGWQPGEYLRRLNELPGNHTAVTGLAFGLLVVPSDLQPPARPTPST